MQPTDVSSHVVSRSQLLGLSMRREEPCESLNAEGCESATWLPGFVGIFRVFGCLEHWLERRALGLSWSARGFQ